MAQVKANEVDTYTKKPNPEHKIILVYGPDSGAVSERTDTLIKNCGLNLDDPMNIIHLDADEAASEPAKIADEANAISMFGGDRLVRIRGKTQKNLANALKGVMEEPPTNALVVVEAGDLKKTSPLRSRIEKLKCGIALPCYVDQKRDLHRIIDEETKEAGIQIDEEARNVLTSLIGNDRLVSRSEIKKLCIYAGNENITVEHVLGIVGDSSVLGISSAVDDIAIGNTDLSVIKNMLEYGITPIQIIVTALYYFQELHRGRSKIENQGSSSEQVMMGMRPFIHFSRKPKVLKALGVWNTKKITPILQKLEKTNLEIRTNPNISKELLATCLLSVALTANKK